MKLKYQYAFVMIGVVFALSIGGFVYQYYNINGMALFGIIIKSLDNHQVTSISCSHPLLCSVPEEEA